MELYYKSTRNSDLKVSASKAILTGLAPDGGLFVPERIPALALSMEELAAMDYQETACALMQKFFTDFTEEELRSCVEKAYDEKFDTEEIAPLAKADGNYYLELFHGATIAFKDMALSILPHLLITAARKNQVKNDIVILTATSGDTGKAALAGFADAVSGISLTFDVGHANTNGNLDTFCKVILPRAAHMHIHDNHGKYDEHLPLGKGSIDWKRVMPKIRAEYRGKIMVVEGRNPAEGRISLDLIREWF